MEIGPWFAIACTRVVLIATLEGHIFSKKMD